MNESEGKNAAIGVIRLAIDEAEVTTADTEIHADEHYDEVTDAAIQDTLRNLADIPLGDEPLDADFLEDDSVQAPNDESAALDDAADDGSAHDDADPGATSANGDDASDDHDAADDKDDDASKDDSKDDKGDKDADAEDGEQFENAKKVLHAIDRLIDSDDKIRAVCDRMKRAFLEDEDEVEENVKPDLLFRETAKLIVAHYAKRSSVSGGLSGLTSLIPGFGSLLALVGSSLADVVFMLKYEVEMTLCLCHLAGYDISDPHDRQLAFTLASVSSYEVMQSDNKVLDTASLVGAAFWDYSVRELSKHLITVVARILCLWLSRGLVRSVPVLGVVVGASVNHVMTKRTGKFCTEVLMNKPKSARHDNSGEVFEATFVE